MLRDHEHQRLLQRTSRLVLVRRVQRVQLRAPRALSPEALLDERGGGGGGAGLLLGRRGAFSQLREEARPQLSVAGAQLARARPGGPSRCG